MAGAVPSSEALVASLRNRLPAMPVPIVGSLIYGSVARNRHHPGSDVDAVLVTERRPSPDERQTVIQRYCQFVVAVGLRPDPTYPVELFPIEDCRRLLDSRYPAHNWQPVNDDATAYGPDDAWELLYALATPHLCVSGRQVVAELRHAAQQRIDLLHRWGVAAPDPDDDDRTPARR